MGRVHQAYFSSDVRCLSGAIELFIVHMNENASLKKFAVTDQIIKTTQFYHKQKARSNCFKRNHHTCTLYTGICLKQQ